MDELLTARIAQRCSTAAAVFLILLYDKREQLEQKHAVLFELKYKDRNVLVSKKKGPNISVQHGNWYMSSTSITQHANSR